MFDKFRKELKTILLLGKSDKSIYKVAYYVFLRHSIMALVAFLIVILMVKHLFDSNIELSDFTLGYVLSGYLVLKNTVTETLKEYLEPKKSPNI